MICEKFEITPARFPGFIINDCFGQQQFEKFGLWRSLVAHLTGGQGVAGSNPVNPTSLHKQVLRFLETCFSFTSTDSSSYLDFHLLCAATVTFAV